MLPTFTIIQPWTPVPADSGRALAGHAFPVGTTFDCVTMTGPCAVRGVEGFDYYTPEHANGTVHVHQGEYPEPVVGITIPHTPSLLAKWGVPLAGGHSDHVGMWDARSTTSITPTGRCTSRPALEGSFYMEYPESWCRGTERAVYWELAEWAGGVEVRTRYDFSPCSPGTLSSKTTNWGFIHDVTLEEAVIMITEVRGGTPRCWCGETRTEENHGGWNACVGCGTV
jgi:hypothetical protein